MIFRLYYEYRFVRSRYRTGINVRLTDTDLLALQIARLYHTDVWWITRASRVIKRLTVLLCPISGLRG